MTRHIFKKLASALVGLFVAPTISSKMQGPVERHPPRIPLRSGRVSLSMKGRSRKFAGSKIRNQGKRMFTPMWAIRREQERAQF